MTLLVTGSAGFIGGNFVPGWMEASDEPRGQRRCPDDAGNLTNLKTVMNDPRQHFIRGDNFDRALIERLLSEHMPRAIVDFTAESHLNRSMVGLQAFMRTNVEGTFKLLLDRPGHDRGDAIDARKIRNEPGWTSAESFESGLRETVVWNLKNPEWVADVQHETYQQWVDRSHDIRAEVPIETLRSSNGSYKGN